MLARLEAEGVETRNGAPPAAADVEPIHPVAIKRYPGWIRLLIVIGAPGLFWIGLTLLVLRLLHRHGAP